MKQSRRACSLIERKRRTFRRWSDLPLLEVVGDVYHELQSVMSLQDFNPC